MTGDPKGEVDFSRMRERMVERQIARRGVRDERVLAAMRSVPREKFVSPELSGFAYDDRPLPIEADQTISQPYIVALMIEAAQIGPEDRVLEVGAGSGYAAAVMGQIAKEVIAVERHDVLAEAAQDRMRELGSANVDVRKGDGTLGAADVAPFDAILVAAAGCDVPPPLREQLAAGGRLVIPVGRGWTQHLRKLVRTPEGFAETDLGAVRFVPLIKDSTAAEPE